MSKRRKKKQVAKEHRVLHGLIYPAGADDEGRPLAVCLTTKDGGEFLIDPDQEGRKLLDLIDEHVEVCGILNNDDGEVSISVADYRILEADEIHQTARSPLSLN
jgi:hypothetical protein